MKEIIKIQDMSFQIKDNILFEKVNASVHKGEIIGIIGRNGVGKSTLMRIIEGLIQPTKGQLHWLQNNIAVTSVEQEAKNYITNEVETEEAKLLSKWNVPSNQFSQLSGGEKLKARLAKGFSIGSELLLLDEPTNHLDEESTQLLFQQIKQYKGTIILISHDRYFLDKVVTKIWSIESKKLFEHKGNYTSYMRAREQRRLSQQREYEKQQQMVEEIEGQIKELTSWSHKAHAQSTKQEGFKEYYRVKAKRTDAQVKSKKKRLEKELERTKVERVEKEQDVQFTLKANSKEGKRLLEVKNLKKSFEGRTLFENANFAVLHGDKVALVGPNGSGKTTLIKILLGEVSAEGDIWISPSANIGYLTQDVFDLPLSKTPEELFYRETFEERGKVQNLMKHLGFPKEAWKEPIENMSMGERVKCKLMVYILEEKDLLILDEPTNHLDLPSREQMEETLAKYDGTLLIVSHDRYFLEKTTNSQLIIKDRGINKRLGDVPTEENNNLKELLLQLETERQAVLGKLSFMTPKDEMYERLDLKFMELTNKINELKNSL